MAKKQSNPAPRDASKRPPPPPSPPPRRAQSHAELVERAARWLRNTVGCSFVATEIATAAMESPDAIGWWRSIAIVVECKTSRSDFKADAKKPWRRGFSALGTYRYMLAPAGLLQPSEMPTGWGLLECSGRRVTISAGMDPHANCAPQQEWRHESNVSGEQRILLSALQRIELALGRSEFERLANQSWKKAKQDGAERASRGRGES